MFIKYTKMNQCIIVKAVVCFAKQCCTKVTKVRKKNKKDNREKCVI